MGQGPDFDLEHLERIQDRHCDGVGPLIGQMAPNTRSNALVGLPDINWFAVVVEERINAPTKVPDEHRRSATPLERRIKETSEILPKIFSLERREIHRVWISTKERAGIRHAG